MKTTDLQIKTVSYFVVLAWDYSHAPTWDLLAQRFNLVGTGHENQQSCCTARGGSLDLEHYSINYDLSCK